VGYGEIWVGYGEIWVGYGEMSCTLARLLKTLREHWDTVMFRVSLEQMLMAVRGSGRTTKSSPGTGLLSWTGLFFICRAEERNRTELMLEHAEGGSKKNKVQNSRIHICTLFWM
jgi:hypothetical protein